MPEIGVVQLRIMTAPGQQFAMCAFFDLPAMSDDDDPVSMFTRKPLSLHSSLQTTCQRFFQQPQKSVEFCKFSFTLSTREWYMVEKQ